RPFDIGSLSRFGEWRHGPVEMPFLAPTSDRPLSESRHLSGRCCRCRAVIRQPPLERFRQPVQPLKLVDGQKADAMNSIRVGVVAWLLILFGAAPAAGAASTPELVLFSPTGTVKDVRQATARFSVPMVALGDPRLPDPFSIDCPASGKGRWADPTNWVYDFDEDLPAGLRCRFILRDDLRA